MSIKIEVGKKYELNGGGVVECGRMSGDNELGINDNGYGPFILEGMCYHQDGRFGAEDSSHNLSVKREWTDKPEGKTLAAPGAM